MKNKRYRNIKKNIEFYDINLNFTKPYKFIIDGTFVKKDLDLNYNFNHKINKILKSKCMFFTTSCILREIKQLGKPLIETYNNCIMLKKLKCEHHKEKVLSGNECIKKHLGNRNTQNYCIATQDENLANEIKEFYKTPVFHFFNMNQIDVFDISEKTKKYLNKVKSKENNEINDLISKKQELNKEIKEKQRIKFKKEINKLGIKIKKRKK